jgi:hypothetical protein
MSEHPQEPSLNHSGHDVIKVAEGGEVEQVMYEDYWGSDQTTTFYMPDGKQYFEIKKMNEGDRAKYQREAGMQMTAQRKTGDTKIDIDQAQDRMALITNSVINWHIVKKDPNNEFVPLLFNKQVLRQWVTETGPNFVDNLVQAIRKFNPFLQEDLSVEDLIKQRDEVDELLVLARQREAEKDFSSNK